MVKTQFRSLMEWLKRVITQPRNELSRWQRTVRFGYDLGRYGARQLREDRATQMAGALAFRTLFSLLPVFVVGTIVIKAIGGFDQFKERIAEVFKALGMDSVTVQAVAANGAEQVGSTGEVQTLSQWLLTIISQVEHINLAAITWVGVAVLIYSAISLMVTIENSFNSVYRAPGGRAWMRRFPIYFTTLVLGPTIIAMSVYLNNNFNAAIADHSGWWNLVRVAPFIWTFFITWLVLFAIYKWMPHTAVSFRPAAVGAFVAAILVEIGKRTLGAYMEGALSIQQLYGSLGLIPLFMFWVYLMWLVVLFGLEVAATLQMLGGRQLEELEQRKETTGLVDPASILLVMQIVAERFKLGQPTTARQVVEEVGIAEVTVVYMFDRLVEASFLHRLERADGAVALAQPPDQLSADQLIEIGFKMVDEASPGRKSALLTKLRDAQRKLAQQVTLANLAGTSTSTVTPATMTDQAPSE
ncbi:MAG: YihY/virulence factor BrkB family protein [Planctomycetes bacterium]|nr:YihY/virulence factor BrkB family protein [Planctomycetota bacterium]